MTKTCPECNTNHYRSELSLRNHIQNSHPRKWENKYSNTHELTKNLLQEWRQNVNAPGNASNTARGTPR